MTLTTARLTLSPLSAAALAELRDAEPDAHLRAAYGEMLAAMAADPACALWLTDWSIRRRSDGARVGGIGFKGAPNADGAAEVGYGVDAGARGNGYAREALAEMCAWAAGAGARTVLAQTEDGNEASRRVLEACGFSRAGRGDEGILWIWRA